MTNDTTTLNGALTELGETLAENLTMKGINANAEDGLTTLANKIKDIRFDLSAAALTLTASTEEVLLKDSVELSARLVNQNNAPICGAVVLFKTDLLADPVIGHAVTNDDGVATFEYVVDAYGVYDFYAEFLGIEQCTSQQVTVTCDYNLVLSADKDILSYNDSDSCTITGILDSETGLVENEEINYSIMHNETELDSGTLTTDENGEITLEYAATGVGDVTVIFSLRSILQKTFVIEDCDAYFTTSEIRDFPKVNEGSNEFAVSDYNISLSEYSVEFKATGGVQVAVGNQKDWVFACNNKNNSWNEIYLHDLNGNVYTDDNVFSSLNEKYCIDVTGNTAKVYKNDTLIKTYTDKKLTGYPTNIRIHHYSNRANVSYIKVKAL